MAPALIGDSTLGLEGGLVCSSPSTARGLFEEVAAPPELPSGVSSNEKALSS